MTRYKGGRLHCVEAVSDVCGGGSRDRCDDDVGGNGNVGTPPSTPSCNIDTYAYAYDGPISIIHY